MTARRRRGLLVALEGIDGAGKSTLSKHLAASLRHRGYSVALRHEPSDPRLGALAQTVSGGDPWTGAVYFTVDRYLARPDLERDLLRCDVVLSDRSFYSTLAYQGSALSPHERRRLAELERAATHAPDRVVLLEISSGDAVRRLGRRASARGPLEKIRTLARVAREYRSLARRGRWIVLDARRPTDQLVTLAVERLRLPAPRRAARSARSRT